MCPNFCCFVSWTWLISIPQDHLTLDWIPGKRDHINRLISKRCCSVLLLLSHYGVSILKNNKSALLISIGICSINNKSFWTIKQYTNTNQHLYWVLQPLAMLLHKAACVMKVWPEALMVIKITSLSNHDQ